MRFVSIVGDSISTYPGYVPQGYAVFYDTAMQQKNGLTSVYDIWWAKVNQALCAYLCVNNSFSGSKVSGEAFPAACSAKRTGYLHTASATPDLILLYIGFNDFGNRVPVEIFGDSYRRMLSQIKANYPAATIVCATLARSFLAGQPGWEFPECYAGIAYESYNQSIRQACEAQGCLLADLAADNISYETLDGTHPTGDGHLTLYQLWIHWLAKLGLLQ